jgi:molecular chaperone GrpE
MPDDDEKNQANNEPEEKGSRMDAAKAFFRQMYAGEDPGANEAPSSQADSRRVKELEQQIKELEQRTADAENLYKRMAADFDNFRRRMEREREEFANAGVRKAAEAIMPALDDLDRALMYLTPETPADKVIESFKLVASRILQCLEGAGLKRLNTKGEMFDPRFHEPVQQIETTEQPDQSIMHELRGGYILGDRVIRPALVNVALNTSAPIDSVPQVEIVAEPVAEAKPAAAASAEEKNEVKSKASATVTAEPDENEKVFDLGSLDDLV